MMNCWRLSMGKRTVSDCRSSPSGEFLQNPTRFSCGEFQEYSQKALAGKEYRPRINQAQRFLYNKCLFSRGKDLSKSSQATGNPSHYALLKPSFLTYLGKAKCNIQGLQKQEALGVVTEKGRTELSYCYSTGNHVNITVLRHRSKG